ncbi:MAG: DnaJ domain-containing protein [Cyclobacteriaceae bacterium]
MINYYEILGVDNQASSVEIKKAYRKLVKVYHPDINPTPEAEVRIIEITTAYEILADPHARNTYDLQYFEGVPTQHTRPNVVSEEELARKEWRRRRNEAEQAQIAKNYLIRTRFYYFQRLSCWLYMAVAIVFTFDYFVASKTESFAVNVITLAEDEVDNYRTYIQTKDKTLIEATRGVYDHYDKITDNGIRVYYSSVFKVPAKVGVYYNEEWLTYPIFGTMFEFGNIFAYLISIICLVIFKQKEYTDWALTISFIPFFLSLFLIMLVS